MAVLKRKFLSVIAICAAFFLMPVSSGAETQVSNDAAAQGFEAFRAGDWNAAVFLLKKAVSLNHDVSPDTLYMLIMAEMHDEDYSGAITDSDSFLSLYETSQYAPYVNYQKGRALYYLGDYDSAILLLSDFCHENPENEMYASALFWIAESFYTACRYEIARGLYERIVADFPSDAKVPEAEYRIETIDQRSREEKLLYLLKMTGEEYLAAKENYEKQLKEYKTEGLVGVQRQLKSEKDKNAALTAENESLQIRNSELQNLVDALQNSAAAAASEPKENSDILNLKRKADEIENLMKYSNGR